MPPGSLICKEYCCRLEHVVKAGSIPFLQPQSSGAEHCGGPSNCLISRCRALAETPCPSQSTWTQVLHDLTHDCHITHNTNGQGGGEGHPPSISENQGWKLAPNFGMIPLAGLSQTCLFVPRGWVYKSLQFYARGLERWDKQPWPTIPWPPWGWADM